MVDHNALVYVAAAGGALWFFVSRKRRVGKAVSKSGYAPPVHWRFHNYPKVKLAGQSNEPQVIDLVDMELIAQRRIMAPFVVHYRPADLDEKNSPDIWLTVEDGNPAHAKPGEPIAHFLQTVEVKGNTTWAFVAKLRLWRVAPEVIAKLNDGPRGNRKVAATAYPSGDMVTLNLVMGVPGGSYAPASAAPAGEHGTSRRQTNAEMEARGNTRR